jgi:hypothetical protein
LLAIGATAAATAAPATTPAGYAATGYDASAIKRVDPQAIGPVDTDPGLVYASRGWTASHPTSARGTSTTFSRSVVATNTAPFGELASPSTVNNAGSPIRSFVTEADTTYSRVYSGESTTGRYLTGSPPANADAAVSGLALPPGNRADFIQDVMVPAGTRMQSSIASRAFGQDGGLLQFELLERIDPKYFGPGVPFR